MVLARMTPDMFSERLLPGERIVWSGQPAKGLLLAPRDLVLIPFSLVWCGFAVFWEAMVSRSPEAPGFLLLWGAMFIGIGLYFVVGRFLVDAWLRKDMHYAVTDRRILIARPPPFSKFTAVSLSQLPGADLSERANGRGTIRFGQAAPLWSGRQSMGLWSPALDPTPQFIMIDDAARVFDLIQRAGGLGAGRGMDGRI
jgi:hypothetical protein